MIFSWFAAPLVGTQRRPAVLSAVALAKVEASAAVGHPDRAPTGRGGAERVDRFFLTVREAICLIQESGGVRRGSVSPSEVLFRL